MGIEEANGTDEDGVCEGEATMDEECNTQNCPPIHCEWNDWVIGECSDSCGTGTRTNTRTKSVVEANGGTCTGQPSEVEECNTHPCPIDCEWGDWQVGDCDKSCGGGLLTKTRVPEVAEQYGGEECTGQSSVTESCNIQECPGTCINILGDGDCNDYKSYGFCFDPWVASIMEIVRRLVDCAVNKP